MFDENVFQTCDAVKYFFTIESKVMYFLLNTSSLYYALWLQKTNSNNIKAAVCKAALSRNKREREFARENNQLHFLLLPKHTSAKANAKPKGSAKRF